jgi:hypothetical protein
LAILGAAGGGGLTAGFVVRSGSAPVSGAVADEMSLSDTMSPSDTVVLRFPAVWAEADAEPRTLASADGGFALFSPRPIYPIEAAGARGSSRARAFAEPVKPRPAAAIAAAPARMVLASASSRPVAAPSARPAQRPSAVLNDAQIASIKRRLNLTPEQEQYWPAVEVELRKMEYKKDKAAQGSRMASIDMSKVDVDGLKSAGFPLVMSFSDDQRRELKSLAHLLGLDQAMSGI